MIWLSGVEAGARLLSFGFYLIAARTLAPHGFGVVQYTITVALVAFGGLQVLTTAVIREVGAVREDAAARQEVLGSCVAVAAALWIVTSVLYLIAHAAGLANTTSTLGLLVVLSGMAILQLYYAISRGLGDPARQAASYAGASLVQLVAFGILVAVSHPTPTEALVIFGASSIVPVAVYEWRRPVLRGQALRISRAVIKQLWLIGGPLLIAQACYLIWNSLDQLWVQGTLGTFQVGLYASAKNLSLALLVVPAGTAGVLLPRTSQLRRAGRLTEAHRLVVRGTAGALAVSAVVAAVIVVLRVPLLSVLYGHSYRPAAGALALLSGGMVCYAGFSTLTMAALGWGRPGVYTAGIAVTAATEALMLGLLGGHNLNAAALAYSASMAVGLLFVLALVRLKPLSEG